MNQKVTSGVVLRRVNYQEADRILTVLTPDEGKITLIAKGSRRAKSKLAGGIELFSVSDITFINGRSDIGTLISSRLSKNFSNITLDIDRTMASYEMLKQIDKITEQASEPEYFDLLVHSLEGINNQQLSMQMCELWFLCRLLQLTGHMPNLMTDESGSKLDENKSYNFDYGNMQFVNRSAGKYVASHIKLLRLVNTQPSPLKLISLSYQNAVCAASLSLIKQSFQAWQ